MVATLKKVFREGFQRLGSIKQVRRRRCSYGEIALAVPLIRRWLAGRKL